MAHTNHVISKIKLPSSETPYDICDKQAVHQDEINSIIEESIKTSVDGKMDKENPTGTGSFSMNRMSGTTIGTNSHAEGDMATASGFGSHAEGGFTTASGSFSHAEGNDTTASGDHSHAEGMITTAGGDNSHAEGQYTIASGDNSHVQGKCNIEDTENKYAHIVGNGTDSGNRSNAHTLDWDGNAWFAGALKVGGTDQDDNSAVSVATMNDIPTALKNPNALTIYGASYDGSAAVDIELDADDVGALPNTGGTITGSVKVQNPNGNGSTTLYPSGLQIYDDDTETNGVSITAYGGNLVEMRNSDTDAGVVLSGILAPQSDEDAANKKYVDDISEGIPTKVSQLENDSDYAPRSELPEEPLIGSTAELTPDDVYAALMAGQTVSITHTDDVYSTMTFGYTSHAALIDNQIVSSIIFEYGGMVFAAQLFGNLSNNTWQFTATMLAKADAIPTIPESLKNPNALTVNGTTYDGATAVDMTEAVNAMIDAKLAEITNAEGVAF